MLKEDLDFIRRMAGLHYHGGMVLDVGSGTAEFRTREKFPYDLAPLFEPGAYVTFDAKEGDGVDVAGDAHRLADYYLERPFSFLICASLLEHVRKPWVVAAQCWRVLKPGGVIVVSVPWEYETHEDPIDLWRMSEFGLRELLCPYFEALSSCEEDIYAKVGVSFSVPPRIGTISMFCGKAREKVLGG